MLRYAWGGVGCDIIRQYCKTWCDATLRYSSLLQDMMMTLRYSSVLQDMMRCDATHGVGWGGVWYHSFPSPRQTQWFVVQVHSKSTMEMGTHWLRLADRNWRSCKISHAVKRKGHFVRSSGFAAQNPVRVANHSKADVFFDGRLPHEIALAPQRNNNFWTIMGRCQVRRDVYVQDLGLFWDGLIDTHSEFYIFHAPWVVKISGLWSWKLAEKRDPRRWFVLPSREGDTTWYYTCLNIFNWHMFERILTTQEEEMVWLQGSKHSSDVQVSPWALRLHRNGCRKEARATWVHPCSKPWVANRSWRELGRACTVCVDDICYLSIRYYFIIVHLFSIFSWFIQVSGQLSTQKTGRIESKLMPHNPRPKSWSTTLGVCIYICNIYIYYIHLYIRI